MPLTIAKMLWYISFPLFLGLAIYLYIYLPDRFFLYPNGIYPVSKTTFFYGIIAIMLLKNFLLSLLADRLAYLPKPFLPAFRKNHWTCSLSNRKALARRLKNWFRGILLLFNASLILFGAQIYVRNHPETIVKLDGYLYVLLILFGLWLIYYPFTSLHTKNTQE